MTTFELPPSFQCLASRSPNVLLTESLPGNTRKGPSTGLSPSLLLVGYISVLQILPPDISILFCSMGSIGLWSLETLQENLPPSALSTALLSPILAMQHSLAITIAMIPQDPLLSSFPFLISCSSSLVSSCCQVCLTPLMIACFGFEGNWLLLMMFSWRLSLRQSQHVAPPWPSQMAKIEHLVDSLEMLRMILTRSQLQFRLIPMLVLAEQQLTIPTFFEDTLVCSQFNSLAPGSTRRGQMRRFQLLSWVISAQVAFLSQSPDKHLDIMCCFPSLLMMLVMIQDCQSIGFRASVLGLCCF